MTPRLATPGDTSALVRLINRAYRVEDFFIDGDRTNDRDVRARMARSNACFLVVDDPDASEPAALAGAVFAEVRATRGYFGMLSVDPDRQKRGIGRLLVAAVEAHCRAAGCRFLDIDVVSLRRELPAFYRALGFAPFDTAPFPDPGKVRAGARPHLVLMTKPLVAL